MGKVLKAEEIFQFILGIYLFSTMDWSWWYFGIFLLSPDISILAYLVNTKVGAAVYNLFHHKGIAVILGLIGWIGYLEPLLFTGIILYTHSAIDRTFGYGLKYSDDFKHTHLGWIGHSKK